MQTTSGLTSLYSAALADARRLLAGIGDADLTRPTPCAAWDLRALLGHMIGQNEGFATAIATGDAGIESYTAVPIGSSAEALRAWDASVQRLLTAAAAPGDRPVRLVEIAPDAPLPADVAVRIQLVDTVIHAWDVAVALGRSYRPADEILAVVAAVAEQVPDDVSRTAPGAAFAPALATSDADPWAVTLARLGRDPTAA